MDRQRLQTHQGGTMNIAEEPMRELLVEHLGQEEASAFRRRAEARERPFQRRVESTYAFSAARWAERSDERRRQQAETDLVSGEVRRLIREENQRLWRAVQKAIQDVRIEIAKALAESNSR